MEISASRQEVIQIIVAEDAIIKLISWIQSEWRTQRGHDVDPNDQLLHWCKAIDSIIEKIQSLKNDLDSYDNTVKEIEKYEREIEESVSDPYAIYETIATR
jgi:hypothetical protein